MSKDEMLYLKVLIWFGTQTSAVLSYVIHLNTLGTTWAEKAT